MMSSSSRYFPRCISMILKTTLPMFLSLCIFRSGILILSPGFMNCLLGLCTWRVSMSSKISSPVPSITFQTSVLCKWYCLLNSLTLWPCILLLEIIYKIFPKACCTLVWSNVPTNDCYCYICWFRQHHKSFQCYC